MRTDITLTFKERTLIIDTKYYSKSMQCQFDKRTIHSNNLYQIHSYVMNYDVNHTWERGWNVAVCQDRRRYNT
ncbi:hypothetical protein NXW75_29485 [Bacteroides xylanisolvens]|nr:hypothetical protein [Bacteroides xylanisolvens]